MNELDLSLKDLGEFYGSMQYYTVLGVKVTDGVKYLMDNGYSWVVTDAIAVIRGHTISHDEDFLTVELKIVPEGGAKVVYTNGNHNILYEQYYEITNAQREIKVYYDRVSNVMCLPSEY